MYKTISNPKIFIFLYLIFVLVTYLADQYLVGNPSILYILAMAGICGICLIRGDVIGKQWLVLIPIVGFGLGLMPALSSISFTSYLYHALAIIIGIASPALVVSNTSNF